MRTPVDIAGKQRMVWASSSRSLGHQTGCFMLCHGLLLSGFGLHWHLFPSCLLNCWSLGAGADPLAHPPVHYFVPERGTDPHDLGLFAALTVDRTRVASFVRRQEFSAPVISFERFIIPAGCLITGTWRWPASSSPRGVGGSGSVSLSGGIRPPVASECLWDARPLVSAPLPSAESTPSALTSLWHHYYTLRS